jgi:hypothetical protein
MTQQTGSPEYSITTMLAQDCLLRVHSEVFGLDVRDITIYDHPHTDSSGAQVYGRLRLAATKTGVNLTVT